MCLLLLMPYGGSDSCKIMKREKKAETFPPPNSFYFSVLAVVHFDES